MVILIYGILRKRRGKSCLHPQNFSTFRITFFLTNTKSKLHLPKTLQEDVLRPPVLPCSTQRILVQSTQKRGRFFYICASCTNYANLTEYSLLQGIFSRNAHASTCVGGMRARTVGMRERAQWGGARRENLVRLSTDQRMKPLRLVCSHLGRSTKSLPPRGRWRATARRRDGKKVVPSWHNPSPDFVGGVLCTREPFCDRATQLSFF